MNCLQCNGPKEEKRKFCSTSCRIEGLKRAAFESAQRRKGKPGKLWTAEMKATRSAKYTKEGNPLWKGGKHKHTAGYSVIWNSTGEGRSNYKLEHRAIVEAVIGRPLKRSEVVHHIDGNKLNNSHSNLLVCSQAYHKWLHNQMERAWIKEHILDKRDALHRTAA